jgi:hypothetical protein
VWVDSKKRLTKCDETGNVENRIRRELVKLHAIDKEKPMKKLVGRKRKAAEKKCKEHNPISASRLGDTLVAGEDDRRRFEEKALLFGLLQIGLLERRGNPLGGHTTTTLLHHFLSVRNLFDGHSKVTRSGAERRMQAQGRRSNGNGGGIESW